MSYPPTPEQAAAIEAFATGDDLVIQAGAGTGKALRHDQPVMTPTGYRPISDLLIGDPVIGRDGLKYHVTGVFHQGIRPLFDIAFSDGTHVIADAEHRWLAQFHKQRDRGQPGSIVTTAEMLERGITRGHNGAKWFIPMAEPIKHPDAELPLDPWLLGVLIGDGTLDGTISVTNPEPHIIDRVRALVEPLGIEMHPNPSDPITWRLGGRQTRDGHRGFFNPVVQALKQLGLRALRSHEKFIPSNYLLASIDQRAELMRGLFDTDGSREGRAAVEYTTTSQQLALDVVQLVQSLGGTAVLSEKPTTHRLAYRLYVKIPRGIAPFSLPRKGARWGDGKRHVPLRAIRSITPAEPDFAVCISVDSPDRLFLTAGCIPTHNTSTLRMLAESAPRRRGLYVAFNRAIANDAKASFPRNVQASTAHSLAFRAVGHQYRDRLDGPRVPARLAAQYLDINGPMHLGEDVPILAPQQTARIVMATVARFARSADREPHAGHLPPVTRFDTHAQRHALAAEIIPLARRAWADLTATRGRLKFTHDHYLKLWQLSYPVLPCEFVLFDEAQDADPVVASIIGNQPNAQRIVVGDSAQAIYEWRGAVNAMEKFPGKRLTLSKSFRFGPAVAAEANRWLTELDAPLRLTGHDPIPTRIVTDLGEPDAILCRSNAGAMTQVMTHLARGRKVALVGGGKDIRDLAAAAIALKAGAPCEHPELFAFRTWGEVQDYVLMDESGSDLRAMVKLIDDYGPDSLIAAIDRLVDDTADTGGKPMALTTQQPDVVVSTAHKAKGREWPAVLIGDDFHAPKKDDDGNQQDADPGELRLAYVAVTRARLVLDRGSLRWLDTYATQLPIPGPQRAAEPPAAPSATIAPSNASATPLRPADDLPAGLIACGPNGRVIAAQLTGDESLTVRLAAAWLTERKAIKDHYDPLIAAATPGTPEYTRLADERTTKLRQLNDQYERDSNAITAGN